MKTPMRYSSQSPCGIEMHALWIVLFALKQLKLQSLQGTEIGIDSYAIVDQPL